METVPSEGTWPLWLPRAQSPRKPRAFACVAYCKVRGIIAVFVALRSCLYHTAPMPVGPCCVCALPVGPCLRLRPAFYSGLNPEPWAGRQSWCGGGGGERLEGGRGESEPGACQQSLGCRCAPVHTGIRHTYVGATKSGDECAAVNTGRHGSEGLEGLGTQDRLASDVPASS